MAAKRAARKARWREAGWAFLTAGWSERRAALRMASWSAVSRGWKVGMTVALSVGTGVEKLAVLTDEGQADSKASLKAEPRAEPRADE